MHAYLTIALGSAAGGVSRLLLGALLGRLVTSRFPHGTLLINVSGCFLLGVALGQAGGDDVTLLASAQGTLLLAFCGSFTTVSTFALETTALHRSALQAMATCYAMLSLAGCVAATMAGVFTGQGFTAWLA